MLRILRAMRARKAATAAILPFVEGSRARLGEVPSQIWRDRFLIGFLTAIISGLARQAAPGLAGSDLGHVQSEAWSAITGERSHAIGEEIALLSLARDGDFLSGCAAARRFLQVLAPEEMAGAIDPEALSPGNGDRAYAGGDQGTSGHLLAEQGFGSAEALWMALFDARVATALRL